MKRFLLPLLGALLLAGCDAMPRESRPEVEEMMASEERPVPPEVLYEVVTKEVARLGFEVDTAESDPAQGRFESHWSTQLAPHRYQGLRRKIIGEILEVPERPGNYRIHATTWVQTNAEINNPLDPAKAIWQDTDPDDTTTEQLFFLVRRHF
jgi:hypothetical protein